MVGDAYEKALRKYFIDNPHRLVVDCYPEIGLNEKKETALMERLEAHRRTLTDEEFADLIAQQKVFKEWQQTPDSKEDLATIPKLSLSDVDRDILKFDSVGAQLAGRPVITVPMFTGGTVYAEICFGLNSLSLTELTDARLYTALLTNLATEKYSYQDLESEIYLQSGGISVGVNQYNKLDTEDPHLYMVVGIKALVDQWPKSVALLQEILETTRFDDLDRIKEELVRLRARYELQISSAGHVYAMQRSQAYLLPGGVVSDALSGLAFYDQLCSYLNRWDDVGSTLAKRLAKLGERLINRHDMFIGLTAASEDLPTIIQQLEPLVKSWPIQSYEQRLEVAPLGIRNEGFGTASQVQYVAQTFDFADAGIEYDGSMHVAASLLSLDYVHNQVRAQGGAYGAGLIVSDLGYISSYSYRDPHLERTLSIYGEAGNYLSQLAKEIDQQTLEVAIIGSMSKFNPPLTAQKTGRLALRMYISGKGKEYFVTYMNQALATTSEDLARFGQILQEGFGNQKAFSVIGNQNLINESSIFDNKFSVHAQGLKVLS